MIYSRILLFHDITVRDLWKQRPSAYSTGMSYPFVMLIHESLSSTNL